MLDETPAKISAALMATFVLRQKHENGVTAKTSKSAMLTKVTQKDIKTTISKK